MRPLKDRIERAEEVLDRPWFGGGDGVTAVIVRGGLPGVMHAMVPGTEHQVDAWPSELADLFIDRAREWARALGAVQVVIAGLPRSVA
jgi:hypothetical protein